MKTKSLYLFLRRKVFIFVVGLLAGYLPTLGFATETLVVTTHNDVVPGSLRAMINQANEGDTVSIPASITDPIMLARGQIQILKSITIQGAGAATTILEGNADDRVFEIGNDKSGKILVNIIGVTIKNGKTRANGGGILLDRGSILFLKDSHIGPNVARGVNGRGNGGGGGIFSEGFLTVVNSTIDQNQTFGSGGGINGTGTTKMDTCTISGNTANTASVDAGGGGVMNGGSMTILNSVISGNHAIGMTHGGGGVTNDGPMLNIDHTTISDNDTTGAGGGYLAEGSLGTLTNTTISGNHADANGGGIHYSGHESLTISNATLFGNDANLSGGGIFSESSGLQLNDVTIAHNTADKDGVNGGDGGGVAGGNMASMTVQNTLIANNFDNSPNGAVDKDCNTTGGLTFNSQGHNFIGVVDQNCVISGDLAGNITNQPAGLDPSGLQANGSSGPLTVALLSGSRAIDAGDPAMAIATDERGSARQGVGPDIGAFEFSGALLSPTPTPMSSAPIPTSIPAFISTPKSMPGGCALVSTADFDSYGLIGLLFLVVPGFVVLRRLAY